MNYTQVTRLLSKAKQSGISILEKEGKLKIRIVDKEQLNKDILQEIKQYEFELIEFLKDNSANQPNEILAQKILPVDRNKIDYIPLSFSQERLWFIDQLEGSVQYNQPFVIRLNKDLDSSMLEKALSNLVDRHEVLRTVFQAHEGQPFQKILSIDNWSMDYSEEQAFSEEKSLEEFIESTIQAPFNLAKDYMFRAHLIKCVQNDFVLVVVMHHIASDGWSKSIMVNDLIAFYNALKNNETPNLAPLPIQFADYAIWERNYFSGELLDTQLKWWETYLKDVETLQLPFDQPRSAMQSNRGGDYSFEISAELTQQLRALSIKTGASLFMTLLAIFKILLHKYSGQEDICVGTSLANRNHKEVEPLVGFFINALVLRNNLGNDPTFLELLEQVKSNALNTFLRKEVPFAKIVERVESNRNLSRNPIFQALFVIQNIPDVPELELGDLMLTHEAIERDTTKFDFIFSVIEQAESLRIGIVYCTDLFNADTIERMATHFSNLVKQVMNNPDQQINKLSVLSQEEEQQIISNFNDTKTAYPISKTVLDLISAKAKENPSGIALNTVEESLTYKQLDKQIDQLASYLKSNYDLQSGDLIGLMMERSNWAVVAMLGILKSGAAFLPIDPVYPQERIKFMVHDAKPKAVLIHSDQLFDLVDLDVNLLALDIQTEIWDQSENHKLSMPTGETLAYVLYTSGSTGTPKGVKIRHSNLFNYINYSLTHYGEGMDQFNFPLFTSLSFDLTLTSIFLSLTSGGTLFVQQSKDVAQTLKDIACNPKINALKLTPAHTLLLEGVASDTIQKFILGGEELKPQHVKILTQLSPKAEIYNEYGPTETTIGCIVQKVTIDDDPILIGKPMGNVQAYILDKYDNAVPIGAIGELCIGGSGVGEGYLNRSELNKKKFVRHLEYSNQAIYKTGDLAKWLPDGSIKYIGRLDEQVKIRGYRIEVGEIEKVLSDHPKVDESVVLCAAAEGSDKALFAYYIPSETHCFTLKKLLNQNAIKEGIKLHTLANGLSMYTFNKFELEFVYDELFIKNVYFKHGLHIPKGGTVVDIGANSGMFSILASTLAEDVHVYAYEPIPPTFELLALNAALYPGNFHLFNCGVSSKEELATFSFYPNATVLSTRSSDHSDVSNTVKQFIMNSSDFQANELEEDQLNELLEDRLVTEHFECQLKTVSTIIKENNLNEIDYLKIDVEDEEMAVLEGIEDHDWPKIKQMGIEVHDKNGRLEAIKQLLKEKGFEVYVNQTTDAQKTSLYDLYAISSSLENKVSPAVEALQYDQLEDLQQDLKAHLLKYLPAYMLPSLMIAVPAIPLTNNGKVDKQLLVKENSNVSKNKEYVGPRNNLDTTLLEIWQEILPIDLIDIHDNFFELGGHSLLAIRIISRIKEALLINIPVSVIFDYPQIAELSDYIQVIQPTDESGEEFQLLTL